jgi:hypothetical protein
MIPRSDWGVEVYPAEIRFFCEEKVYSLQLELTGQVEGFTLEQDLEKRRLRVFGKAKEGYYNFEIVQMERAIVVTLTRGNRIPYQFNEKKGLLERNQFLEIPTAPVEISNQMEKLSLGMNKKLDWDLVTRRGDLKEILPVLYSLGQIAPAWSGAFPEISLDHLVKYYFESLLLPKRFADKRLGISLLTISENIPVSGILYKSYEAIRALFIREENNGIFVLPALPPKFVCGRMTGIKTSAALFDMEWSKGKLHKMRIKAVFNGSLVIKWPKDVDSFRIKLSPKEKGKMISHSDSIILEAGQVCYLDKFQK